MNEKIDIISTANMTEDEIRLAVKRIISSHTGRGAITVINAGYNSGLHEYIEMHTAFLDKFKWVNFSTRCYAFAEGLTFEDMLPHCTVCGKLIESNVVSVHMGFKYKTCSRKCAANSENRNARRRKTMIETYGNENWNNRAQYKKTCMDRFGVECNFQSDETLEKSRKTKLEKYGDENWNNRERAIETCLELYGMGNNGKAISDGKKMKSEEDPAYYSKIDEKGKKTKLETYGDENWNNRPLADKTKTEKYGTPGYNNRGKAIDTCMSRYGVDNPSKLESSKSAVKTTCLERYGVDNPAKLNETVEKAKVTNIEKFGEAHYAKTEYSRLKVSIRKSSEQFNIIVASDLNKAAPLFSFGEFRNRSDDAMLRWKCNICGKEFDASVNFIYARQTGTYARCPHCHPTPNSCHHEQQAVEDFIMSVYGGNVRTNDRSAIYPLEIDAYAPNIKTGIEFNGMYWHSAMQRSDLYHMAKKSETCAKKGIRLFQIMEDEWKKFKRQTEWRISQAFGTRGEPLRGKLSVAEIKDKAFHSFMSKNSNDAYVKLGKKKLGVFAGKNIVLVISLTEYREKVVLYTIQDACWTDCSEAVKMLMSEVRAKYRGLEIFVRLDNRYPYDKLLLEAGFSLVKITAPAKWILDAKKWKRIPRIKYARILQAAKNSGKCEIDYLHESGMTVIYDCGQRIYRLAQ